MNTKQCSKCQWFLPLDCFNKRENYLLSHCKSCAKQLRDARKRLKNQYKTPAADYQCPICKSTAEESKGHGGKAKGPWVLDHCHKTMEFRGWLCHKCNRGLGNFKDDSAMLFRAIEYLTTRNHEEKNTKIPD